MKNIVPTCRLTFRLTALVALALCAFAFNGCYLVKQGLAMASCYSRAVDNDTLLERKDTPDDVRRFLERVADIRRFAMDSLGLKDNKNYTRYAESPRESRLVDVVAACEPDTFETYHWRYPFFGAFPYKGFFERKDAEREARRLREKGYDVHVRGAGAFSTLGFLRDPLFSHMQRYSPFSLASLIIHEQTHATLFLKDQVQFNEELAVFVGRKGAFRYLAWKHGPESDEVRNARARLRDREAFDGFVRELYDTLNAVYASSLPAERKLAAKENLIATHRARFNKEYQERFISNRYRTALDGEINNASLVSRMTYVEDFSAFEELLETCNGNLRQFMADLAALKEQRPKDPKAFIRANLQQTPRRHTER